MNPQGPKAPVSVDPQVLVLHSKLENVQEELKRMGAAMSQISESLQILARLEQGHSGILERLRDGAARFKEQDARISAIEQTMPGLKELRVWVIGGVLGGASMLGVALLKLVLVDPQSQATSQQVVISATVQQAVDRALSKQQDEDARRNPDKARGTLDVPTQRR